ncbi:glucosamine--fructose-6-phosphate aminotransferase (isomerizing) [Bacillus thuringiensis]|uniref:Glutamine--fructose-6-phosphate aminotransferase [isomerizing] n=1 Tax=Bacillus thuringiensis TaxID=1428 RepID=A0A4R4B2B0_BACTU|nr:glutamine--fructose-6-phosphate transaminase (isomerizing) [Bacillus thuringiensis]TCW47576.1 glucosamine--fructose-6-phosphate aminotransferase (isomerizing) [Bacillus thuringiensis]TCW47732.1 glucosamine--fructose-6-phosphate aminotransferase (isomerizing) [Bacillus thuringiensis]
MCGIIGFIGETDTKDYLLNGLEKLEYRGYDSAGIALFSKDGVHVFKDKGRIKNLRKKVDYNIQANVGIGQTRWATHGVPNKVNAHPHCSMSNRFTLVHNGVIENYQMLSKQYLPGYDFKSETDTEVIVGMIEKFSNDGLSTEESFLKVLNLIQGSYAIALIDSQDKDRLYIAKNKSPMLVGLGNGNFNMFASDAMPMIHLTNQFLHLLDEEVVIVDKEKVTIKNLKGEIVQRSAIEMEFDVNDMDKGSYDHYMLKEIDEQPFVIRRIIEKYKDKSGQIKLDDNILNSIINSDRVYIIGCGTSYHAGLVGKQLIENWAKIPVEVHVASEFSYNPPILSSKPFFIFISQSGETADSRSVLKQINKQDFGSLTITNVPNSTLSRESNHTLLLHAGPEIAVASTKAYTAQIAILTILASELAKLKELVLEFDLIQELSLVANAMEVLCDEKEEMEKIAKEYLATTRNCFFIGRSVDFYVGLEGALKLKEISYIQAEGFAGGELKHGTIALIEKGTPVIALATQKHVSLGIRGNVQEVATRGANPCIIAMKGLEMENDRYILPSIHEALAPLLSVIPFQLISYYAALHRECDVDKPRNLAKSVTVE